MPRIMLLLVAISASGHACRWAIVAGAEQSCASALVTDAAHSLAHQSYARSLTPLAGEALLFDPNSAAQRNHNVNLDGYGIGWWDDEQNPHRFRSGRPAVNMTSGQLDVALKQAADEARSTVIFAHIRAATEGDRSDVNSHPFQFGQLLWMHNGGVADYKRRFATSLACPEVSELLAGETDSEFAGALFAHQLGGDVCLRSTSYQPEAMTAAMRQTLNSITSTTGSFDSISSSTGVQHSSLNFAASDGRTVVVTRFRTSRLDEPPSLYFAITSNSTTRAHLGRPLAVQLIDLAVSAAAEEVSEPSAVSMTSDAKLWVASEPLDGTSACVLMMNRHAPSCASEADRVWVPLAKDQLLSFDTTSASATLECLSEACRAELKHRWAAKLDQACPDERR
eukprot:CAMPEP_0174713522 /NCGR_PEP_ID=MMETSP1094-20130205/14153_1 /TAXON_ID=156173 /ORGANISM="Chrysochromulina brevifilum, Strain UTEX LB 985" /LENGTH=394 /DNA_ID=CAMNT_0015912705 /DNA_START=105 /DNA_END=1289 /DNA_ORIENTATION=+